MDVEETRSATDKLLGSSSVETTDYITQELLDDYEAAAVDAPDNADDPAHLPPDGAPPADDDPSALVRVFYGNRLAHAAGGRLYFSNGSPNRPNDPCGRQRRWYVQLTPGSRLNPYRNCGGYWGYQIVVL